MASNVHLVINASKRHVQLGFWDFSERVVRFYVKNNNENEKNGAAAATHAAIC